MRAARQAHPDFDITRSWALADAPAPNDDESLEQYLRRIGFTDAQMDYTRRAFANATGDSMAHTSARTAAEEWTDTSAGDGDYRVVEGYIRIHEHLARGLDIRLNTVVTAIEWNANGVRVQTAAGEMFEGDSAIITLPLGVLKSGAVAFTPVLPEDKQAAINALRMGPAMKLVYRFSEPVLPEGTTAFYSAGTPPMWWSPSVGRDVSEQVITAFATGDYARQLSELGEVGALHYALQTLKSELGRQDLLPSAARWIHWTADPFSLGGYSVAAPGAHGARAVLAQPTPPLFWAGEAAVKNAWASTVHGALESGRRAAANVWQFIATPTPVD
jgi:monoamine oxidase